jgi:hypothetical protein
MRISKDMQISARKITFFNRVNLFGAGILLLLGIISVLPVGAQEELRQETIDDENEASWRQQALFDDRIQMHEDHGLPFSDSWKASHPEYSIKLNPNPMVEVIQKRIEEKEQLRTFFGDALDEEEFGNPFRSS